jgi:hypothetical protein
MCKFPDISRTVIVSNWNRSQILLIANMPSHVNDQRPELTLAIRSITDTLKKVGIITLARRDKLRHRRDRLRRKRDRMNRKDWRTCTERLHDDRILLKNEFDQSMVVDQQDTAYREMNIYIHRRRHHFSGKQVRHILGRTYRDYAPKSVIGSLFVSRIYRVQDLLYDIRRGGMMDPREPDQRRRASERYDAELAKTREKRLKNK